MKTIILLILAASVAVSTCYADLEAGRRAARRGDFNTALREWHPLAENGDAEAQFYLGRMYARGDGVKRNFKVAKSWFEKAAAQGHAGAEAGLGLMYERGDGVEEDYDEAAKWYMRAAAQGDKKATRALKDLYRSGRIDRKKIELLAPPPTQTSNP